MRLKTFFLIFILLIALNIYPGNSLRVIFPNGGEIIKAGTTVNVRWKATNPSGQVAILLYKQGVKFSTISKEANNNGSFLWRIPPTLKEANNYRIRIRLLEDLTINDFSDRDFKIIKK